MERSGDANRSTETANAIDSHEAHSIAANLHTEAANLNDKIDLIKRAHHQKMANFHSKAAFRLKKGQKS